MQVPNNFNKMIKKIFLILISLGTTTFVSAQNELGFYNFNNIHQSSFLNVSNHNDYKFSMGLPGIGSIYAGVGNTGFSLVKDLIDSTSDNNRTWWTKGNFVDQMKKTNFLYSTSSFDLISFRFKSRHSYYSFNISDHQDFRFMYPKDLFGVLRDGNGEYIGKDIVLDHLQLNAQYYREFAVGYQKETKSRWSYGFRVKLLQGLASIHTSKSTTTIHTAKNEVEGNDITVKTNMVVNTSYNPKLDTMHMDNIANNNYKEAMKIALYDFSNIGMAIDLGASYKLNKRLLISGSINNLGYIKWKENPNNYSFGGDAKFTGVVVRDINASDTTKLNLETMIDSLTNKFKLDSTKNSYKSSMVGSSTVNLSYKLGKNTTINALVQGSLYKTIRLAASVGIQQKIARWFTATAYWSAQYNKYDNLGFGFMAKPGFVQIYAVCDNFMPLFKSLDGKEIDATKIDFRNSNIRFGINIALGRVKKPEAQTFEDYYNK